MIPQGAISLPAAAKHDISILPEHDILILLLHWLSRPDSNVRLWAKLKCPVLPLDLKVCVPWFQYKAALKDSLEPALGVSPFS
jgi:hypothetical protein